MESLSDDFNTFKQTLRQLFCLSVCLNLVMQVTRAQKYDKPISLNNIDYITFYIASNYKLPGIATDTLCYSSCVFVKFKISADNKFYAIDFTKNTPPYVKDALKIAFKDSENHLKFRNVDQVVLSKKTFILPFIFTYNAGCSIRTGMELDTTAISARQREEENRRKMNFEHTGEAVFSILDFENVSFNTLNCIILRPVRIGGVMY